MSTANKDIEQVYYDAHLVSNKYKLQKLQDVMSLSLGIAAGTLGLESYSGIAFYLVGILASDFSFLVVCCEGTPKRFFVSPVREIFADNFISNFAGYIMMWCLTYALMK
ncbi:hypothetical protein METBIDRAFT_39323 [Metschnikowia bicuspidata var. bicuspidata NRRL YB-4993]|uniref:ER membrane protein complex subunit 6 n=1 Tax=Metschnikowia bicuspidata var. bicuspidata NRRL YB-4993 TaxID=869754 RepID=A0A1A0HDR6_9ASCO|nr:hypothetical protein METBIDRAFT_39323 [Metschnikowia bicuspidata var. bicuspidata NRRL YB-4993]OBA22229.1 hypothetical protein METBIDRAFT_39323 [Metschnikowia bicuspidata var. bicuspidata NRRL YB-4993]